MNSQSNVCLFVVCITFIAHDERTHTQLERIMHTNHKRNGGVNFQDSKQFNCSAFSFKSSSFLHSLLQFLWSFPEVTVRLLMHDVPVQIRVAGDTYSTAANLCHS